MKTRHGWLVLLVLIAMGAHAQTAPLHWKAVLVAASAQDGLPNWDNARRAVRDQLTARGVAPEDIVSLSASPVVIGTVEAGAPVGRATVYSMQFALEDLALAAGDAVIIFVTSHGQANSGILMGPAGMLTPVDVQDLLAGVPPEVPVVLLLSACYSGQFLGYHLLKTANRVLLTAARNDRTSFGCGAGSLMPEWDQSLVAALAKAPRGATWADVLVRITADVARKEAGAAEAQRSYPQGFIGSAPPALPARP